MLPEQDRFVRDTSNAFRKFLADRFGIAPRSEEEAVAATAEISRDPRLWGPNPGEFKARLDSLLNLGQRAYNKVKSVGPDTFVIPDEQAPTTFREAMDAPAFKSFIPPSTTEKLPKTFVRPLVEQSTSPVGLLGIGASPAREVGASALGIGATEAAKAAGAGPGVQTAAGIGGAVIGGAPEIVPAVGKAGVAGAKATAKGAVKAGAALEKRGIPSPIGEADAATGEAGTFARTWKITNPELIDTDAQIAKARRAGNEQELAGLLEYRKQAVRNALSPEREALFDSLAKQRAELELELGGAIDSGGLASAEGSLKPVAARAILPSGELNHRYFIERALGERAFAGITQGGKKSKSQPRPSDAFKNLLDEWKGKEDQAYRADELAQQYGYQDVDKFLSDLKALRGGSSRTAQSQRVLRDVNRQIAELMREAETAGGIEPPVAAAQAPAGQGGQAGFGIGEQPQTGTLFGMAEETVKQPSQADIALQNELAKKGARDLRKQGQSEFGVPEQAPVEPPRPVAPVTPKVQAPVQPQAAPSRPTGERLPSSLSKASPRYKTTILQFESDIDRALYIVANPTTRSKAHDQYVRWLESVLPANTDITAMGRAVRSEVSRIGDAITGGSVRIPRIDVKPKQQTPFVPTVGSIPAPQTIPAGPIPVQAGYQTPPRGAVPTTQVPPPAAGQPNVPSAGPVPTQGTFVQGPPPPSGTTPVPSSAGAGQPPIPGIPAPPAPQTPSEITRSLSQAAEMVRQDKPGAISKAIDRLGVKGVRDWERPGRNIPDHILGAHVAENSARAELETAFAPTRVSLLDKMDEVFGEGVANDGKANVRFIGPQVNASNPITGKFVDIANNPQWYDLNPAQKQFLADFDARNNANVATVDTGYGTTIGTYQPSPGGAFITTIRKSDDAATAVENFYKNVPSGTSQVRVYPTIRERMIADPTFVPETNPTVLLRAMDEQKARAASGEVFRAGAGGLDAKPTGNNAVDQSYKLVQHGVNKWFPPEEADIIIRLRERAKTKGPIPWLAHWQATVLGGDFSPLTIQGMQQFLGDPIGTARAMVKGKFSFSPEAQARLIASDPQGWKDFSFYTGRSFTEPTPKEFGAGLLGKIPKAGPTIQRANNSMYNFVTSVSKNTWDAEVAAQMARGVGPDEAKTAAADIINRVIPQTNPTRYGLSPAQAQARRVPFTSTSFIRKSGELVMDASRGYAKIAAKGATLGKAGTLTTKERLAVGTVTRMAALTTTISVTSAVIEAQRTGQDPVQAAQDAINPGSPRFMSLVVAGKRVPLGGPLRAIIAAVAPRQVSGVPFPVPFGGMPRYLENRIQPGISTGLHWYANKDYSGRPIYKKGQDSGLVSAAKIAAYVIENMLPVTAQQVAGDVRTGEVGVDTAVETAGQVVGQNIIPLRTMTDIRKGWEGDTRPYFDLPSNEKKAKEKKVSTRPDYRRNNPKVEAKLFIMGEVKSFGTDAAKTEAVRLMKELNLTLKDIGFEPDKYDSDEQQALRKELEKKLGVKSKSQPKTNTSPTSPTKTKSGSSFDQALQGAGGSPRRFIGK